MPSCPEISTFLPFGTIDRASCRTGGLDADGLAGDVPEPAAPLLDELSGVGTPAVVDGPAELERLDVSEGCVLPSCVGVEHPTRASPARPTTLADTNLETCVIL